MNKWLAIIIPGYNVSKTVEATLESTVPIAGAHDDVEIIFVDDGSTDETPEIVKHFKNVKYLRQENAGPSPARNLGWRSTDAGIVCFVDADCTLPPDMADKFLKAFEDESVAAVGGSYRIRNPETLVARVIHEEIVTRHLRMAGPVHVLGSFCLAVRRKVLEDVEGFNENFAVSAEDMELSFRITRAGHKILMDPTIAVGHIHPSRLLPYLRKQLIHGFYRPMLYREYPEHMKGDEYAGLSDFIQPPLAVLLLAALPLIWLRPVYWVVLGIFILLCLMQIPIASRSYARTGHIGQIVGASFTFLRAFARGIGLVGGIICYWILRTKSPRARKKSLNDKSPYAESRR
jgi:GT2 family glycosyltransferase